MTARVLNCSFQGVCGAPGVTILAGSKLPALQSALATA